MGNVTFPAWLASANSNTSGTTLGGTYTNSVAAGKHVLVLIRISGNVNISSFVDSVGNTYQIDLQNQTNGQQIAACSAFITNAITGGATTFTMTLASAVTSKRLEIQRMDGAATTAWFGGAATSSGSFGTPRTTNSLSPATIGDGIINFYYTDTTETAYTVGAGYTVLPQPSGLNYLNLTPPNGSFEGQWKTASATGAQTPPSSTSGQSVFWAGASLWYKQAAGTTYTKTGLAASDGVVLGADVSTHSETGAGAADGVASGADVSMHAETGAGIAAGVGSAADVATHVETGLGIAAGVALGGRLREKIKTGIGISDSVVSGPDVSTHIETGIAIAAAVASGTHPTPAVTYTKTGLASTGQYGGGTREVVTLTTGLTVYDGVLYIPGKGLYGVTNSSPAKLVHWADLNDLATYTSVALASDGKHNAGADPNIVYTGGVIYVAFSSYLDISDDNHVVIEQFDPDDITTHSLFKDFIVGTNNISQGNSALATDGTYLMVLTKAQAENSWLARVRLSDGNLMNTLQITGTTRYRGHAFGYDPVTSRYYFGGTKLGPAFMWVGWAAADLSSHDTADVTGTANISDDIAFYSTYFFVNRENDTTGTVLKIAKDLSSQASFTSGYATGMDGMALTADGLWVVANTSPAVLVLFDPATGTKLREIPLNGGETNINEIVPFGNSLVLTTFESPSRAMRIPLLDPNGMVLSGAKIREKPKTGIAISDRVASGPDVSTHAETGAGVTTGVGSGPDVSSHARTGAGVSDLVASGPDVSAHSETGAGISPAVASGGDASAHSRTGIAISALTAFGARVIAYAVRTGAAISALVGSGADVATHAETGAGVLSGVGAGTASKAGSHLGTGISDLAASGPDVSTHSETGAGTSAGQPSGADQVTYTETGIGQSAASASGADAEARSKTGISISALVASAADVAIHGETGAGISAAVVLGASARAGAKAGTGVSAAVGSAADVVLHERVGSAILSCVGAGADVATMVRAGLATSQLVALGADVAVHAESGIVIAALVAQGVDRFTATEVGICIAEAVAGGAKIFQHGKDREGFAVAGTKLAGVDIATFFRTGTAKSEAVLLGEFVRKYKPVLLIVQGQALLVSTAINKPTITGIRINKPTITGVDDV